MCLLWLTAILPVYKNTPECAPGRPVGCAVLPWQLPLLFTSFAFMSLGSGGIRPCTLAFGADQLDKRDNSANNVRTLQTFFNWYYTVLGLSIVFASTVIVYIQQARGWVVGFAVPVVLMVTALTLFLLGSPFYIKAAANSSVVIGFVQVLVASYNNRHEPLPPETADSSSFYNKAGCKPRTPTNKLRYYDTLVIAHTHKKKLVFCDANCELPHS
jgi:solute carrier family 15 (peptide/histidine transporter), member 3/4